MPVFLDLSLWVGRSVDTLSVYDDNIPCANGRIAIIVGQLHQPTQNLSSVHFLTLSSLTSRTHPSNSIILANEMESIKAQGAVDHGGIGSRETKTISEKFGTIADQRDMFRMGKTQKLRVCSRKFDSS